LDELPIVYDEAAFVLYILLNIIPDPEYVDAVLVIGP
jgi:hypothetical protein